jgi:hypothetical protein
MNAIPTCRRAENHHRLGRSHNRLITAIFALLEIVLVGLVIASLIAVAIASQLASPHRPALSTRQQKHMPTGRSS